MKQIKFLMLLLTIFVISCKQNKKRILLLGDSITHGVPHNYRYDLWKYMIDAGWEVDLIGTVEDWNQYPTYKEKTFDTDHEGHSGWTSNQINSSLRNWVKFYTADVVLYHIGTNDMWQYGVDTSMVKIAETVKQLRKDNPKVQIYLSKIIPVGTDNEWVKGINGYKWQTDFNERIRILTSELNSDESPIKLVDHNSGFTDDDLTEDKVHPNKNGAEKMAMTWARSLGIIVE